VYIDQTDRENLMIDWSGGGAAAPFTISPQGGAPVSVGDPGAQQAVMQALKGHGIDPSTGSVDLRRLPAARAAVLAALCSHGIDAAHSTAAADPATPVPEEKKGEPLERLTKLMQLRAANLVTEEEFESIASGS
jgi:hypothetical protein